MLLPRWASSRVTLGAQLAGLAACAGPGQATPETAGVTETPVVTVQAPRDITSSDARAALQRTASGLVDGPVTDLVDEVWRDLKDQHELLGEPLGAVVSAGVLVRGPALGLEFQWLVTRERTQLLRFVRRSDWSVLGERSAKREGDAAVMRLCQRQLDELVAGGDQSGGGGLEPLAVAEVLAAADILAQGWPQMHARLSTWRKLDLEPAFDAPPTVLSLMNASVVFISEQPEGELRVAAVTPEQLESFASPFHVDSRQLLLSTDAWSITSALPRTSITPWLDWTVAYVDAGRQGAALPAGFVPYDEVDPLRPLYRVRDSPEGRLAVGLSKVHLRYATPVGLHGTAGLQLELLLVDGRIKIGAASPTNHVPTSAGLPPEAAAMFQPVVEQLRDGDYKALQVTPADIAWMEAFANKSATRSSLLKLPSVSDLAKLRQRLRSVPSQAGKWYVEETQHLARTAGGQVFGIEVDVERREQMLVETTPLFRLQKLSDPSP